MEKDHSIMENLLIDNRELNNRVNLLEKQMEKYKLLLEFYDKNTSEGIFNIVEETVDILPNIDEFLTEPKSSGECRNDYLMLISKFYDTCDYSIIEHLLLNYSKYTNENNSVITVSATISSPIR